MKTWRFIYRWLLNAFFAKTHYCMFLGDYLQLKTLTQILISLSHKKRNARLSNHCFVKQWTNFFKSTWQHTSGLLFHCIHRWCSWGRKGEILAKVTGENRLIKKSHGDFKQGLKHRVDLEYLRWPMTEIVWDNFKALSKRLLFRKWQRTSAIYTEGLST